MISIDWDNREIYVPKSYTQLVSSGPPEIRQLDLDTFRLDLKNLEDDIEGIPFLDAHRHIAPVTVGGVSLARVVEIINGYTVTFENGSYLVNLVGANTNVSDVTNLNAVGIRSNNSAGLTFSDEINNQSYGGIVYINPDDGSPGISFPRGTPSDPVSNYQDAYIIGTNRKFDTFSLHGALTIGASDDITHKEFIGRSSLISSMVISGTSTDSSIFSEITLSGEFDGRIVAERCVINGVTGFDGLLRECEIGADITVDSACSGLIRLIDCVSAVPGTARPILDVNGATCNISIRNYTGGLTLKNITSAISVSVDILSGTLEIHSSCTAGSINVRGMVYLINNTGGSTVVTSGTITELASVSGGLTVDQATQLEELHKLQGLKAGSPMTVTQTQRAVDDIVLDLTGDGITTQIVTRQ